MAQQDENEEQENLDDVDHWTNTQVQTWHAGTFSDRDNESVAVRSLTPFSPPYEEERASMIDANEEQAPIDEEDEEMGRDVLRATSDRHENILDDHSQRLCQNGGALTNTTSGGMHPSADPQHASSPSGETLSADKWMMSIEGTIVMGPHNNLLNGLATTFTSFYVFNLQYPKEASSTLEFAQRSS
ncbi:hypothetical protein Q8A67_022847 [Cirrhinus molitorella]|uniref:Uncharacterized protein n=1 Tax=Cirrhinus molitorella TaxID=172907 RepID=A0AA88P4T1_9TELE|nr:hypothetical protein Q8A67_022847 [Cirrhinus molitorella]